MALNYTHYCLGENNRLFFADKQNFGYSEDGVTETYLTAYDSAQDSLYFLGAFKNKLYMVKKYNLYEIDQETLSFKEIPHKTSYFDWYGTGLLICGNFLYYTTRTDGETDYFALDLNTLQIKSITKATWDLFAHEESQKAHSFNGINLLQKDYDEGLGLYYPKVTRYELNSEGELEEAATIKLNQAVKITKAFLYDDHHVGIYSGGKIDAYHLHSSALVQSIPLTVQSKYLIFGMVSDSLDLVTLVKATSSNTALYLGTKLLKSHTSFQDFKRQDTKMAFCIYRADNVIQMARISQEKQKGTITLALEGKVLDGAFSALELKGNVYAQDKAELPLHLRSLEAGENSVHLKGRIVETIKTIDLPLKGHITELQNGQLLMKENIFAREKAQLQTKEYVEALLPTIEKDLISGITSMAYFDHTLYIVSNDSVMYTTNYKDFKPYQFPSGSHHFTLTNSETYLYIAHALNNETFVYCLPKAATKAQPIYKKVFTGLNPTLIMVTPDDAVLALEDASKNLVLNVERFFETTYKAQTVYGAYQDLGKLVGVAHEPNNDPERSDYVYHLYLEQNGTLQGYEWDANYDTIRKEPILLTQGELSYTRLLKPNTVGYIYDYTLYVHDFKKQEILYRIEGASSLYGYKESQGKVYIALFNYGNLDLYRNEERIQRIMPGFGGYLKATCNADHALLIALSDTKDTTHKLYGFNLSYLYQDLKLTERITDPNLLYLDEFVVNGSNKALTLKERVFTQISELPIQENIQRYYDDVKALPLYEKVLKPNHDFMDLTLNERVTFRPGEWGSGHKQIYAKGRIQEVPFEAIFLKGNVLEKTSQHLSDPLTLSESVWAYHTYVQQKEHIWSENFYTYYRDNILEAPAFIRDRQTTFITPQLSILEHDYIILECDQRNVVLSQLRLIGYNDEEERFDDVTCDSYTLMNAYTGEKKQVYGFKVKASFDTKQLRIDAPSKAFTLLKIYDAVNPSKMGDCFLTLKEVTKTPSVTLPIGERVWLKSDGDVRYLDVSERVCIQEPDQASLTLKEESIGLDGKHSLNIKGKVSQPQSDSHDTLYAIPFDNLGSMKVVPVKEMPHRMMKASYLMVGFSKVVTDWEQDIFLKIQCKEGLKHFTYILGIEEEDGIRYYTLSEGKAFGQTSFSINLFPYIKNVLKDNLMTDKVRYIGIRGLYDEQMVIDSMMVTRRRGRIQRDLTLKGMVLTNVRTSLIPNLLRYRDSDGHDTYYNYKDRIDFDTNSMDQFITNVMADFGKTMVPQHITVVSSQKLNDISLHHNQKGNETPTMITQEGNRYIHEFNLSDNQRQSNWMILNFKDSDHVIIDRIEVFHSGYKANTSFPVLETVCKEPEKVSLSLREHITYQPSATLLVKGEVDRLVLSARALSLREKVLSPEHTAASSALNLMGKIKPYTYSRAIWLNEIIPSDREDNTLAVYDFVTGQDKHPLSIHEKVVSYKKNSDGRVIVEYVPH